MELLLLPVGAIAVVAAAVLAFMRSWPSTPEPGPAASLLTSQRQMTTGQIARGVFWGMWLFWLSQIFVAGFCLFVALFFGAVAMNSVGR